MKTAWFHAFPEKEAEDQSDEWMEEVKITLEDLINKISDGSPEEKDHHKKNKGRKKRSRLIPGNVSENESVAEADSAFQNEAGQEGNEEPVLEPLSEVRMIYSGNWRK